MKFKYLRLSCKPTELFPDKHSVLRPIINITVKFQDRSLRLFALLDSGADWCLFPASVGEYLHIQVEQGEKIEFTGVSSLGVAYFHEVKLEIGGWGHNCLVGFSPDLDKMNVPAVLGHTGFFDRYEVTFNFKKETIEVKPNV
jgi:hypothetical protein